jgi:hypothetical protein
MTTDLVPIDWSCHWESWSRNGEVCIVGLAPPFAGGATLASCLTWFLRAFASHCRRTHDATGALAFTYTSERMPSTIEISMATSFELVLRDPKLIRARVRQRGGDGAARRWPALWLEGLAYDYVVGRDPLPPPRTPRRKLLLLAEERQVFVPTQAVTGLGVDACRAWESGLSAVAGVEEAWLNNLNDEGEHNFAVNMLALVHAQPARKIVPRPSLESNYRRHAEMMAELASSAGAKHLSLAWHALWRLPPAMTWSRRGHDPWMRYPAVSLAVVVRPLRLGEARRVSNVS